MSISPPPSKRARVAVNSDEQKAVRKHELSIYSYNVNGIDPLLQTTIRDFWKSPAQASSPPIRHFLRRHGWPTLCLLQEIKIHAGDSAKMRMIQRAVSNAVEPDAPDYEAHFCLPSQTRYPRGRGGRFYGVCTLVCKEFAQNTVHRIRPVGWDDEGRILVAEINPTATLPKLAILNVYLVNGTDLPYRNAETGAIVGTRHERKLEVHKLLQAECHELQQQGFGVIVAGDINVARSPLDGHPHLRVHPYQHVLNRSDFEHRFLSSVEESKPEATGVKPLDMLDTFRVLNPLQRGYSYFPRGIPFGDSCDRVDMILVSRFLILHCTAAGMHQTLAERATSDHVPIFAMFTFEPSY